jgi:hypothetical protein
VRNLGHPPKVLLHIRSEGTLEPGDPVLAGGEEVGRVTGSTSDGAGCAAFVLVPWNKRDSALSARGETLALP